MPRYFRDIVPDMRVIITLIFATSVFAQDRMPPTPADKYTDAQKKSIAALAATPRGASASAGPWVPLLRSPELMDRVQAVGDYLRFHNTIPQKLVEMTILMTSRYYTQQYEWSVHYPLALKQGLKEDVARSIAKGQRPAGMAEDEETVWLFNNELIRNHGVSDATYARALKSFGEKGIVDLTVITGYYGTIGMVMNVARTPAPSAATSGVPALEPLGH